MGRHATRFSLLIFLLLILQPHCSAAGTSEPSTGDVRALIIDTAGLADEIDTQISILYGLASQIAPCPCEEDGTDACSDAKSVAISALSSLNSQNTAAKNEIQAAATDFGNGAPLYDVLQRVGNALAIINSGINTAIVESDRIPDSCPDDSGSDICPYAKSAVGSSLSTVIRSYQSLKDRYDKLAGTVREPTPQEREDTAKNDRLASVYPKLGQAQRMRETIKNMAQSGASQSEIDAATMTLRGLERQASDVYDSILLNSRYKNDFWTNWDYATLKKNQGDAEGARKLYATAFSSANVDESTRKAFMDKLKRDGQAALKLSQQPKSDDKVVKSMRESLHEEYDRVKLMGYSVYMDFHSSFVFTLAKAGKIIDDMKQFRDAFSGKSLEQSAEQAGN